MKNKIEDVRNHLVSQMEALNDDSANEETVRKAQAMSSLATAYIHSVKVEIDALRLMDDCGAIPASITRPTLPARGLP